MTRKLKLILAAAAVVAVVAVTGGVAIAGGDDEPLVGATLEQATEAALADTGGGTVTETEVGDDGAAYGVEIRLPDGSQVEVELDGSFAVTGREADDDSDDEDADDGDEDEADDD